MSCSKNFENWVRWQNTVQSFFVPTEINDILSQTLKNTIISSPLTEQAFNKTSSPSKEILNLEELFKSMEKCQKCRLGATRTKLVFGEGNSKANLMFIGEGPGQEEDATGRPFVGKAGALLTKIIENGLKLPRKSVYIANIVKCRPPGNRDPLPDEAESCIDHLHRQIDLIKPSVIVLLGRVAAKYLINVEDSIAKARENHYQYKNIPVFITYHPSALLRNEKFKRPVWEDLKKVMKILEID